jgi:hypothetical protein
VYADAHADPQIWEFSPEIPKEPKQFLLPREFLLVLIVILYRITTQRSKLRVILAVSVINPTEIPEEARHSFACGKKNLIA